MALFSGSGETEVVTTVKETPYPEFLDTPPIDVNITWLLSQINMENNNLQFSINRYNFFKTFK